MEEEKKGPEESQEVQHWKDLLASHMAGGEIRDMPDKVVEVLSRDPDIASQIADAILKSIPGDEGEDAAVEEGQAAAKEVSLKESAAVAAMRARKEREDREQKKEQAKRLSLMAKIARLDVGEKAKLARTGDKDARSILIKDANKQVCMAVLANPRMTIQEIEVTAASRNVGEDILREIGNSRDWCKSYTVILALVNNPKTPVGVSLTHMPKLLLRDLRFIAKSKGIPDAIRVTAKRFVQKKSI